VNGNPADHSDDQQNRREEQKHAHLRIGFDDLPRDQDLRLDAGSQPDVRMQTLDWECRKPAPEERRTLSI
jgi:hypothetical protein